MCMCRWTSRYSTRGYTGMIKYGRKGTPRFPKWQSRLGHSPSPLSNLECFSTLMHDHCVHQLASPAPCPSQYQQHDTKERRQSREEGPDELILEERPALGAWWRGCSRLALDLTPSDSYEWLTTSSDFRIRTNILRATLLSSLAFNNRSYYSRKRLIIFTP